MKQDTQSKFAAILAAAQNKAAAQATPKFAQQQPAKQPETAKPTPAPLPDPIPEKLQPVIEVLDGLTAAEEEQISSTIAEIFAPQPVAPEPAKLLSIVDYSEKSFAVIGDTKPIKNILSQLGGKFNYGLKCGPGWIFAKTRIQAVKDKLAL